MECSTERKWSEIDGRGTAADGNDEGSTCDDEESKRADEFDDGSRLRGKELCNSIEYE